jgi:hypothetical protein
VTELDKPSDSELGRALYIGDPDKESPLIYSDLDELIISHVGAIARKIDALTNHEKYKPEAELGKRYRREILVLRFLISLDSCRTVSYPTSLGSTRPVSIRILFG